jgi:hypothetical protein
MLAVRWDTTVDLLELLPFLCSLSLFPRSFCGLRLQRFDNPSRQRLGLGEGVVAHLDPYMFCLPHVLYRSLSIRPYAGSSLGVVISRPTLDLLPASAPLLDELTLDC